MGVLRRVCVGLIAGLLASLALAADSRTVGPELIVNEVSVLTFRGPNASGQATNLAANLRKLKTTYPVTVKTSKREAKVFAGGVLILRVTKSEALANKSLPEPLARLWASRLDAALSLPALKLESHLARVPVGGKAAFKLVGSEARFSQVASNNPAVATATKTESGIVVQAKQKGAARIELSSKAGKEALDVEVWPYAAPGGQRLSAQVLGSPASTDIVRLAANGSVYTQLATEPGGEVRIVGTDAHSVAIGVKSTVYVRAIVSAPNAFPVTLKVPVVVENLGLPREREAELWYCNHPENVLKPAPLYRGKLRPDVPVRMLYHHLNAWYQDMAIRVLAINNSASPVAVSILPGDGTPNNDPVRVGTEAGERFLKNWVSGSAEVVTIPPHSSLPIALRRLGPRATMSGIAAMRVLGGNTEVDIVVDAVPISALSSDWVQATRFATPWSVLGAQQLEVAELLAMGPSGHVYPQPFRDLDAEYSVGGRIAFLRIGQEPIASNDATTRLDGNFGVIYTMKAAVSNPTQKQTEVEVVFEASAGYSGAIFFINGVYQRSPLLQPKDEYVIRQMNLPPGASQRLTIVTVPLSGSSYPATITIRPKSAMILR